MQLSKNFTLNEMLKSPTAERMNIKNTTSDPVIIFNLSELVIKILQPLRDHLGHPITINSGYRSPETNTACGGAKTSQHMSGCAADMEVYGMDNKELALTIRDLGLPFDQIILEFYKEGQPDSGWVHVSYDPKKAKQRGEFLVFTHETGYTKFSEELPEVFRNAKVINK
jgi:hypothetical protein